MQLPGGIYRDGEVCRSFAFAPITGSVELAMAEGAAAEVPLSQQVTDTLAAALTQVGGVRPTRAIVHRMSVGDRQFLMRQLATHLGMDEQWLTARCGACGSPFDFNVRQSALPVKKAGAGYPFADVRLRTGHFRFRVPTGEDQAAISGIASEEEAVRTLALRLIDAAEQDRHTLENEDLALVEDALEQVAPEVTTELEVACPECGEINRVRIDPYACLDSRRNRLFVEIHQLARAYHWSESDILALPRKRRQTYIGMIDADRGMTQ